MKIKFNFIYITLISIGTMLSSCDSTDSIEYPRQYIFNSILVHSAQVFVLLDSQNLAVLPNRFAGSFNHLTNDYFISDGLKFQNETEGFRFFNMKSKDELEFEFFF